MPFTLLFGVATSIELLQARLLKSVCQQIYGAQFDAVQSGSILETVFKIAVAAADVPVRIGGPLLRSMLERQQDQVAGIQSFVSSLKVRYDTMPWILFCSSLSRGWHLMSPFFPKRAFSSSHDDWLEHCRARCLSSHAGASDVDC